MPPPREGAPVLSSCSPAATTSASTGEAPCDHVNITNCCGEIEVPPEYCDPDFCNTDLARCMDNCVHDQSACDERCFDEDFISDNYGGDNCFGTETTSSSSGPSASSTGSGGGDEVCEEADCICFEEVGEPCPPPSGGIACEGQKRCSSECIVQYGTCTNPDGNPDFSACLVACR